MNHILRLLHKHFFSDKHGNSRGWHMFVILTFAGIALAAYLSLKATGPKNPPMHSSVYFVLPAIFSAIGGMFWAADVLRRRRFLKQEAAGGQSVECAIAEDSKRNARSAGVIAAVIGLTFVPIVVFGVSKKILKEYASQSWTPMTCQVVKCEIDKPWTTYVFRITVAYVVNNVGYEVVLGAPNQDRVRTEGQARQIESQYQAGTHHRLYVNPHDPREASLRRGPTIGTMIATVTMPLFGLICVVASVRYLLRGPHEQDSKTLVEAHAQDMDDVDRPHKLAA